MGRDCMMGSIRRVVAIVVLACGVTGGMAFSEPAQRYRNPASVCIRLTVADQLSGLAFNTVREEATRIWERHGIALNWKQPAEKQSCPTVVPIVFDGRALLKQGSKPSHDALGLTVFHGRTQT